MMSARLFEDLYVAKVGRFMEHRNHSSQISFLMSPMTFICLNGN